MLVRKQAGAPAAAAAAGAAVPSSDCADDVTDDDGTDSDVSSHGPVARHGWRSAAGSGVAQRGSAPAPAASPATATATATTTATSINDRAAAAAQVAPVVAAKTVNDRGCGDDNDDDIVQLVESGDSDSEHEPLPADAAAVSVVRSWVSSGAATPRLSRKRPPSILERRDVRPRLISSLLAGASRDREGDSAHGTGGGTAKLAGASAEAGSPGSPA